MIAAEPRWLGRLFGRLQRTLVAAHLPLPLVCFTHSRVVGFIVSTTRVVVGKLHLGPSFLFTQLLRQRDSLQHFDLGGCHRA